MVTQFWWKSFGHWAGLLPKIPFPNPSCRTSPFVVAFRAKSFNKPVWQDPATKPPRKKVIMENYKIVERRNCVGGGNLPASIKNKVDPLAPKSHEYPSPQLQEREILRVSEEFHKASGSQTWPREAVLALNSLRLVGGQGLNVWIGLWRGPCNKARWNPKVRCTTLWLFQEIPGRNGIVEICMLPQLLSRPCTFATSCYLGYGSGLWWWSQCATFTCLQRTSSCFSFNY